MIKRSYRVIGVMSGTSLDGVDLVYARIFFTRKTWHFEIIEAETIDYSYKWRHLLKDLVSYSSEELLQVDIKYTKYLSAVIKNFIKQYKIRSVDFICSHGHTALHRPDLGITYQIGNRKELAEIIGKTVVCDFRVQDVKLGGQGAPLVPIGDALLFSEYDFCLNLGGFSNVSTKLNETRIAYDICPVNVVLNKYAELLGKPYDENGTLASKGVLNEELLSKLNALPYYNEKPPKSLGLEWVNSQVFPVLDASNDTPQNILRTFTEHIAIQLAKNLNTQWPAKTLVTGGGCFNKFLIARLSRLTSNTIIVPSKNLVEFKEALVFALLGVLKVRGEINCLSSVTGASENHSSGNIFVP